MLINGVDARTTYGFALESAPSWLDAPPRRTPSAEVLRRGGSRVLDKPREQTRSVTLRGTVLGSSADDARNKLDALKMALSINSGAQLTFDDEPTRYVLARCEGFRVPPSGASMIQSKLTVEATMVAYDPYSYDLDDAAAMFWYDVGDALPGESFSRSTAGNQFDVNGVLQAVPASVKREGHYIGGVRTHLLEKLATNIVTAPRDLTNTVTWVGASMSRNLDQVGLDGAPNSATRLTAQAANATILFTGSVASSLRTQTAWIRRNSGIGTVEMTMDGGTTWTNLGTPAAGGPFVKVTIPNQTLANPVLGFRLATSGSQVIVDFIQNEAGPDPTSPYAFAGSRTTEVYTAPWNFAPNVPMTLYLKYIELSTDATIQRRYIAIGTTEPAPEILFYFSANTPTVYMHNGTTAVSSSPAVSPAIGDLMELRAVIYPDGHVVMGASKNGAAEVLGPPSAAQAFAAAFTVKQLRFGVASHIMGLIGVRAFRGEQSMAQIRAATKPSTLISESLNAVPLGTGPVRPLLRIDGAAVNPTIALVDANGTTVGSITLTVTTIAGDVLLIDCNTKTITLNGAPRLDILTSGDFFTIDPIDGNFAGTGPRITTSSGALSFSYRRTWR